MFKSDREKKDKFYLEKDKISEISADVTEILMQIVARLTWHPSDYENMFRTPLTFQINKCSADGLIMIEEEEERITYFLTRKTSFSHL